MVRTSIAPWVLSRPVPPINPDEGLVEPQPSGNNEEHEELQQQLPRSRPSVRSYDSEVNDYDMDDDDGCGELRVQSKLTSSGERTPSKNSHSPRSEPGRLTPRSAPEVTPKSSPRGANTLQTISTSAMLSEGCTKVDEESMSEYLEDSQRLADLSESFGPAPAKRETELGSERGEVTSSVGGGTILGLPLSLSMGSWINDRVPSARGELDSPANQGTGTHHTGVTSSTFTTAMSATSSDSSDGIAPSMTVRETSERMEEFRTEVLEQNLVSAHRMLLLTLIVLLVFRIERWFARIIWTKECPSWARSTRRPEMIAIMCCEAIFVVWAFSTTCWLSRASRSLPYYIMLALSMAYTIVTGILPTEPACEDFVELLQCTDDQKHVRNLQVLQCGPHGRGELEKYIVVMLLSPYLIPEFWNMHCMWLFVVGYTLAASIWVLELGFYNSEWIDVLTGTLMLAGTLIAATCKKYWLERSQLLTCNLSFQKQEACGKLFNILGCFLPQHAIVPVLQALPGEAIGDQLFCVSIMFITICDFQSQEKDLCPEDLLGFLNRIFTRIDETCQRNKVTKIETVGEEYVAAVGVAPADIEFSSSEGHCVLMERMLAMAGTLFTMQEEEGVKLRMGMHTGPVVAGVVGKKLPRFRLFGDTVNTAARMMQKGVDEELQFGDETLKHFPHTAKAVPRGHGWIEMKGKGRMKVYLLERNIERENSSPVIMERTSRPSTPSKGSLAWAAVRVHVFSDTAENHSSADLYHGMQKGESDLEDLQDLPAMGRVTADSLMDVENSVIKQLSTVQRTALGTRKRRPSLIQATAKSLDGAGQVLAERSLHAQTGWRRRTTPGQTIDEEAALEARLPVAIAGSEAATKTTSAVTDSLSSNFQDMLDSVANETMPSFDEVEDSNRLSWSCLLKGGTIFPSRPSLHEDEELRWMQQFYVTRLRRQARRYSDLQAAIAICLTVAEACVGHFWGCFHQPHPIFQGKRLAVFVSCRSFLLFVVAGWRFAEATHQLGSAAVLERLRFASLLIIAVSLVVSYDALTPMMEDLDDGLSWEDVEGSLQERHYWIALAPLMFIITFSALMMDLRMRYRQSCLFALILLVLFVTVSPFLPLLWDNFVNRPRGATLLLVVFFLGLELSRQDEKRSLAHFRAVRVIEIANRRTKMILRSLMPPLIVEELKQRGPNEALPSHHYSCATIAQSDLVGFTKLASALRPSKVLDLIEEIFGLFDDLCDQYGICKVETVGDAYIAGQAGSPLTPTSRALSVVIFSMEMQRICREWASERLMDVGLRVGVHTGSCSGGIVGTSMQRYHLFGKLLGSVEGLESTAPEGEVQISKATAGACLEQMKVEQLPQNVVRFEARMIARLFTSKGDQVEYDEVGGSPTFLVRSYRPQLYPR